MGAAVRLGMVDQQPRLEVLAVVGEVQAEQLGVAAGGAEPRARRQPHHVAAEGDRDMAQHRVLAERGVMRADVHRVVGPVGDRDHRQPGGVADDELDVVGVGSAAALVDDDDGLGQLADPHLQMPVGRRALAGPGDRRSRSARRPAVSLPTVTIVALLNDENAWAATRSAGTPPWPSRSSPRRTVSTVTPGRSVTSMCALPVAGAEPSCRPRNRFSGVNRQISSRPCGTSKASTSNDVKISPLVLPSRVAVRSCATDFRRFARPTSRPRLPSAARSAG